MNGAITIVPLIVILILVLPPFRLHMMIAGLVGAIVAIWIGGISIGDVTGLYLNGLTAIMSITSVMILAAAAKLLAEMGAIKSIVDLFSLIFRERLYIAAGFMVLIQAGAVYAAGLGAGNTIVTAPMVNSLIGFVPEVVAAMSIVSPTSWATSPSSAESAVLSEAWGVDIETYAAHMRPYVFVMWGLATLLAVVGTYRRGIKAEIREEALETPMSTHLLRSTPFMLFLLLILIGPWMNQIIGAGIFTPVTNVLIVVTIAQIIFWDREKSWRENLSKTGELFIESARPILTYLFLAGAFLGYINLLQEIGTFTTLAGYVEFAPPWALLLSALIIGFIVAIPAGNYTVATLLLILPTLAEAGVEGATFGFVAMAVAYGAMISPVQINVAATADGFGVKIPEVISNNTPYMPAALLALIIILALAGVLF
jgi:hypothetical protein